MHKSALHYKILISILAFVGFFALNPAWADDDKKTVTFIHTGDIHGDFDPHPNFRADSNGLMEGGLARVYSVIQKIREKDKKAFYIHTGDTISGSAETTFTRGMAMVSILNLFKIDAFVPGNWEFSYGVPRFLEFFAKPTPKAPWGALSANAYYTGEAPFTDKAPGSLLLDPYRVVTINDVKVGIFACTTNRGPTIVSANITQGVAFTNCKTGLTLNAGTATQVVIPPEIPYYVNLLRTQHKVDLVILLSEAGLAENIYNAEHFDGIDIIFSSDMHEKTPVPVIATTPNGGKTILIEEGEDGGQVGELAVDVKGGKMTTWRWKAHPIDQRISANKSINKAIDTVKLPFYSGSAFVPGRFVNPFNGAKLMQPLDTIVGYTEIPLTRNAFSNEAMPGLIEGTGHLFITDAFRTMTGAQIGAIRGFRYTNSIAPGPITLEDLYHYMPIGPQVAIGEIKGAQINNQAENSADSCMNPDVTKWLGGWMFNFSGLVFDLDPYKSLAILPASPISAGRVFNFSLDTNGDGIGDQPILDTNAGTYYTYASYFYADNATQVNRIQVDAIKVPNIKVLVKDTATHQLTLVAPSQVTPANVVDAVDVVAAYLQGLPNKTITKLNTPFPRIKLTSPLPDTTSKLGFPVIEPLYGMDPTRY